MPWWRVRPPAAAPAGAAAPRAAPAPFTSSSTATRGNTVEKQIVDTFNKTSKVKAVLDTIPGADYQQKLQTIINTQQAPDVFFNWGGGSIAPFVKAGLLMPLDDFIDRRTRGSSPTSCRRSSTPR